MQTCSRALIGKTIMQTQSMLKLSSILFGTLLFESEAWSVFYGAMVSSLKIPSLASHLQLLVTAPLPASHNSASLPLPLLLLST